MLAYWSALMEALPGPGLSACAVSVLAACLGAACALAFARSEAAIRVLLLAGVFALLALPAPPLDALPALAAAPLTIAAALGRALALVALFCIPNAAAIPRGLRRAALAAGATPARAWRDAVMSVMWFPAVLGIVAAWLRGTGR